MKNLLPYFIQERLLAGEGLHGEFSAHSLFIDIAGFSSMTSALMQAGGDEGAEVLSAEVNQRFALLIEAVQNGGGTITGFAGDAFTAIFFSQVTSTDTETRPDPGQVLDAARQIQAIFGEHGTASTRFGDFELAAKVGISTGRVRWGIVGSVDDPRARLGYYVRGPAIDGCARAEQHAHPGQIVLDHEFRALLDAEHQASLELCDGAPAHEHLAADTADEQGGAAYYRLLELNVETRSGLAAAISFVNRASESGGIRSAVAARFFPRTVLEYERAGEFRPVAAAFVSFAAPDDPEELHKLLGTLLVCLERYSGYLNHIDFGDKGANLLVLFGAPLSTETDGQRAVDLAIELGDVFGEQVRIGLSQGRVFAGMVGSHLRQSYTVAGAAVNLAARLMVAAPAGTALAAEDLVALAGADYRWEEQGAQSFKGFAEPIAVHALADRGATSFRAFEEAPFSGRTAELAEIHTHLDRIAAGGFAGTLRLSGPAGSGKSRLLHEAWRSRGEEIDWLFAHGDSILRRSLHPFIDLLVNAAGLRGVRDPGERRTGLQSHLEETLAAVAERPHGTADANHSASEVHASGAHLVETLRRTESFLAAMVHADTRGELYERVDAQARYENTLMAVRAYIHLRARVRPTVLVIENLHSLDADSLAQLVEILRHVDSEHVAFGIIVAGRHLDDGRRPPIAPPLDADGAALDEQLLTEVEPAPLDEAALAQIATALLERPPGPGLIGLLAERTEGNPFYLEQFCRLLLENDTLLVPDADGALELAGDAPGKLPAGVAALTIARLDRLPLQLRRAVHEASVAGSSFSKQLLAHALNLADDDLLELLHAGQAERIWQPTDVENAGEVWRFSSALLQEAAYGMQLKSDLRARHGKAGAYLAGLYGESPAHAADIAYHFGRAESVDQARQYYELAAQYAHANYKAEKAFEFYDMLQGYARNADEALEVVRRRSSLMETLGRWSETEQLLKEALALAERESDARQLGRLESSLGALYQKQGAYDQARAILERSVEHAETSADTAGLGEAHGALGRTYWSQGRYDDALACFAEGLSAKVESGDRAGYALQLYHAGVVHRDQGAYDQAMQRYLESLEIFENELGDRRYATYPMYDIAVIYQYQGRLDDARDYFQRTLEHYEEIGYRSGISAALLNLGVIESRRGRNDAARELYLQSLEHAEDLGEKLAIAYALFCIGTAAYQSGDYADTISWFERSFVILKEISARGYYGYVLSYLSCCLARQGQTAKALKAALQHLKNIRSLGGSDVENGRSYLGVALALRAAQSDASIEPELKGSAAKLLAELGQASGLPARIDAYFELAVETARRAEYVMTLVPALREYALYLVEKSAAAPWFRQRAEELFAEAWQTAGRAGMQGELDRIERDAAAHDVVLMKAM